MQITVIYDEGPFAGTVIYNEGEDQDILSDENKRKAWGHYGLFKKAGIGATIQGVSPYVSQNTTVRNGVPHMPDGPLHLYQFADFRTTENGAELRCKYLETNPPSSTVS